MIFPPSSAVIWADSDSLHVCFPSTKTEKTHTVSLPLDERGLKAAVAIFRARHSHSTVGTKGAPTKLQVQKQLEAAANKFIKAGGKVKKPPVFDAAQMDSAREVLRQMGLI